MSGTQGSHARLPLRGRGDPWLYAFARIVLVPAVLAYGRLRVTGVAYVPERGPALLVANHPSDVDPILMAIALRRPLRFMADAVQFRRGFVGPVIRRLRAFPVHLDRPDTAALRQALALLRAGELVALFPEGALVRRAEPQAFGRGVAFLAAHSGAPVVPVAIRGAEHIWSGGRPHRPPIEVRFGAPLHLERPRTGGRRRYTAMSEAIRDSVVGLLK